MRVHGASIEGLNVGLMSLWGRFWKAEPLSGIWSNNWQILAVCRAKGETSWFLSICQVTHFGSLLIFSRLNQTLQVTPYHLPDNDKEEGSLQHSISSCLACMCVIKLSPPLYSRQHVNMAKPGSYHFIKVKRHVTITSPDKLNVSAAKGYRTSII